VTSSRPIRSKRRGRGEGAIFLRADGVWCATITIGYDAVGKRRRRTVYGASKEQVRKQLTELHSQALHGGITQPTQLTVAQYLTRWLEDVARPKIRVSTYRQYEGLVRLHMIPHIGGIRLTKLTPAQVQGLYATLLRAGVSPRQCQMVHSRLFSALKRAVRWKLIPSNPCADIDRPTAPTKRFTPLTPRQVLALLDAAAATRLHALYVLAIFSGLRQGELLGLHWEDLDLETGMLRVRHQLQEVAGDMQLVEPKTATGRRQVALPRLAVEALVAHRERMQAKGFAKTWVFCDSRGGPIRKSNLRRKSFEPLLAKAELPHIRFHDLRHTAATLLLLQEVHPKVVQERLGHSRVGITLDIYSHVLPTMQRGAADKLDGLMDSVRAEAAAECREAELKDDNGAQQSVVPEPAEKDWLQLGYSSEETAFCATDAAVPNESDSQANPEWSHLDSNQGPPACEAGALTS
jgi:integrase